MSSGAAAIVLSSCTTLTRNAVNSRERMPQANDGATQTGGLALTAFRSTVVATVRQPLTTLKTGAVVFWNRPRELVTGNLPVAPGAALPDPEQPGGAAFEALLDREGFPPAEPGRLTYLPEKEGFFEEFDRQVRKARTSIDIQVYIFDNDDIGVRCADELKRRSDEVAVRILFDDLGTTFAASSPPETLGPPGFVPPADMEKYLREGSSLRVRRTLNPWLVSDHTKLMVFDERVAILGGMNLGREYYSEWHDLMVSVEGPVVSRLADEFDRTWRKSGIWGDFATLKKRGRSPAPEAGKGEVPLRILKTDPAEGRTEVLDAMMLAIRGSRERVWIENPYFASDDIAREVEAAARRGVDVRVILPSRNDSTIMDAGNLGTARGLIEAGAKVYRYPGMSHLKVMICDGWATLGSANLDTLSMRINRELNLGFSDPETVRGLERAVFSPDFRRSDRMKLSDTDSAMAPLAEAVADHL